MGRPRNRAISASECRMLPTKSGRSLTYRAIFVDVEPGLIARILNSSGCKNHPQGDGVYLVVNALHARWNEDRDLRAGDHMRALRASQILHGLPEQVPGLDVRNHHAIGMTR